MINYKRIKKDCFWDYNFTDSEIEQLALSPDIRENRFLFEKILLNSASVFSDLKIFNIVKLSKLIKEYQVPQFNSEYIFKRKNMVEAYFLGKPILVNELKWIA